MQRHHFIDYIEFTVVDVAEAKAFYAAAFDWKFTDYGPDYAGIQGDDREQGGLCKGTPGRDGGVLAVLFSEDLDESLNKVTAAGGTIDKAPFDFPGGRRFEFRDPSGNPLAVWTTRE